jgi:hypothetical protein
VPSAAAPPPQRARHRAAGQRPRAPTRSTHLAP